MCTSGRTYAKTLSDLRRYFLLPLRTDCLYSKKPTITEDQLDDILIVDTLETLHVIHQQLLADLEEVFRSDTFDRVGRVFLTHYRRLPDPYLRYLVGYDKSAGVFQTLTRESQEFCILLKRCETSIPGATFGTSLNLQSYLIQPCQRLPR